MDNGIEKSQRLDNKVYVLLSLCVLGTKQQQQQHLKSLRDPGLQGLPAFIISEEEKGSRGWLLKHPSKHTHISVAKASHMVPPSRMLCPPQRRALSKCGCWPILPWGDLWRNQGHKMLVVITYFSFQVYFWKRSTFCNEGEGPPESARSPESILVLNGQL